jgi:hypothetical protein
MNLYKIFILFFIFSTGCCDTPLLSNDLTNNISSNNYARGSRYAPYKKKIRYYSCKHRGVSRPRRVSNPYTVFATDILRKYIYIVNVVVIYIILYSI